MKRLIKKDFQRYHDMASLMKGYAMHGTPFWWADGIAHRYAVARKPLYDSQSPELSSFENSASVQFDLYFRSAILHSIDYKRAIVCFKRSNGALVLAECTTFKNKIEAVKHAKKYLKRDVVDLRSGKTLQTNG